jgi:cell division protease FtsH
MTREELERKMSVLLGGRVAEKIVFDHLSTGAADDLSKCTDIARSMVTRYGMVPELGHVAFETDTPAFLGQPGMMGRPMYGADTADRIDEAIRELVQAAFDRAMGILEANRELLEETAHELLERETLEGPELDGILAQVRLEDGNTGEAEPAVSG